MSPPAAWADIFRTGTLGITTTFTMLPTNSISLSIVAATHPGRLSVSHHRAALPHYRVIATVTESHTTTSIAYGLLQLTPRAPMASIMSPGRSRRRRSGSLLTTLNISVRQRTTISIPVRMEVIQTACVDIPTTFAPGRARATGRLEPPGSRPPPRAESSALVATAATVRRQTTVPHLRFGQTSQGVSR
jgi:hypothetical protein